MPNILTSYGYLSSIKSQSLSLRVSYSNFFYESMNSAESVTTENPHQGLDGPEVLLILALSTAAFVLIALILYACLKERFATPVPKPPKEKRRYSKRSERNSKSIINHKSNAVDSSDVSATAMIAARR